MIFLTEQFIIDFLILGILRVSVMGFGLDMFHLWCSYK